MACIDKNCNHCHAQNYPKKQEGKLYHKLLPFAQQLDNEFTLSSDLETFEDRFNEVLDEAKVDFPTKEMAEKELERRLGGKWESGLGAVAVHQVLTELRGTWFLKWFGEK